MELIRRDWILVVLDGKNNQDLITQMEHALSELKKKPKDPQVLEEVQAITQALSFALYAEQDPPKEGHYHVLTNTYVVKNITLEQLNHATVSMTGIDGQLRVFAPTQELFDYVMSLVIQQRRLAGFLSDSHPALMAYAQNICNKRKKYKLKALKGFLKNKPILYCGAGPSLGENMSKIKEIIDNNLAFVITGGTGIKVFANHDVIPHMCIALDPFEHEQQRFTNLPEEWEKNTVLLADRILNPTCYDSWKGPLITTAGIPMCALGQEIEGEDIEVVEQGRVGVTTWMAHLADYFQAHKMYMIGVDLCYGEEGNAYADGLQFKDTAKSDIEYNGKRTRVNWINEATDLAEYFAKFDYEVYNCNPDALPIEGCKHFDLNKLDCRRYVFKIPMELETGDDYRRQWDNLVTLKQELGYWAQNYLKPEFKDSRVYKKFMIEYDILQEHLYWRLGRYNFSLLKGVMLETARIFNDAAIGKTFAIDNSTTMPINKSLGQIHLDGLAQTANQDYSGNEELAADNYYVKKGKQND